MSKRPVQVTIINDPLQKQDCDGACGTDWSSLHALDTARKQIQEKFGDSINLTYLDIAEGTTTEEMEKWIERIQSKNLFAPLLIINGHMRISGSFDTRQLLDAIEATKEMGA